MTFSMNKSFLFLSFKLDYGNQFIFLSQLLTLLISPETKIVFILIIMLIINLSYWFELQLKDDVYRKRVPLIRVHYWTFEIQQQLDRDSRSKRCKLKQRVSNYRMNNVFDCLCREQQSKRNSTWFACNQLKFGRKLHNWKQGEKLKVTSTSGAAVLPGRLGNIRPSS